MARRPFTKFRADDTLRRVDRGTAWIVKEFRNRVPVLYVWATGCKATPVPKKYRPAFEERLAASGNGDGLFPGVHQTSRQTCANPRMPRRSGGGSVTP